MNNETQESTPKISLDLDSLLPSRLTIEHLEHLDRGDELKPAQAGISPNRLVPDDVFGAALFFETAADILFVDDVHGAASSSNGTVSLWVNFFDLPESVVLFSSGEDGRYEWHAEPNGFRFRFKDAPEFQPVFRYPGGKIPLNQWMHLVVVLKTEAGHLDLILYLDGEEKLSSRAAGVNLQADRGILTLGGAHDSKRPRLHGKLAQFQLFDRSLEKSEVLELSREGQSANATFRSIYPFDFELHDDVQSDTLYISPDEKTIEFKIRNRATKGVYFEDRFPAHNVDRDNYIFELRFRPRTFADPAGVKASLDRWQASPLTVDPVDGSQSFYFRGFGRLEPGQALSGLLTYRNVNAALGSRSTQMMLQYQRACFDNGSSFNGTRLKHLSVHTAAPAGATLPLHALLAMGSGVLNLRNGGAPPTFALEVFNVASSPLKIREGTRFALSFDDPSQPRSLLDPESIKSLVITLLDTNGSVAGEVTATDQKSPLWVIDWPVLENLDFNVEADAAGRYFDLSEERGFRIQIEGLICNRPSGFGRVRIQYSNLEGHGDGELSVPVLKSPLVAEDGRVGIGTASPVALLHLIDQKREAPRRDTLDGGVPALLLGPPGESHLSFGYDNDYSWLQSGGNHRILKVNPAGGDVEVGGSIRAEAGLRLGPWRLVDWGAPGKTPGLHLSCEPHSIVFQITGRRRLQIQGSVEAAGELVAEVVRAPTIRADSITAKAVVAPILTAESVLNARMARVTESINAAHFVGGEFSGSNVQVREVKTREIKIGDPDAGSKKSIQIDQDGIRIGNWRIQAHEGTYPGHLYFYNIESGKPVYTFAQHGVWGPGFNKGGLSDLRLKTDLQDIGATLPRIRAIRGMRFRWLDHEKIRDRAGSTDIGMLAQEVEAVYPELVTVDSDGYRSVDYGKFGAVLLEGLKEADEKIESQAGRIDALEAEMRELRGKLTRILEKVDI